MWGSYGYPVPLFFSYDWLMSLVASPHIWYPTGYPGPAYDLRQTLEWLTVDTDKVRIRFVNAPASWVVFDLAAYELAKQASLDAE